MKGCGEEGPRPSVNALTVCKAQSWALQGTQDVSETIPALRVFYVLALLLANNASVYLKGTVKPTIDNRRQPSGVRRRCTSLLRNKKGFWTLVFELSCKVNGLLTSGWGLGRGLFRWRECWRNVPGVGRRETVLGTRELEYWISTEKGG